MSRPSTPAARTVRGGVLALLALACAGPPAEPSRDPFETASENGETALREGRLDAAAESLARALELASGRAATDPAHTTARLAWARLKRAQGDTKAGRHHLGLARFAARRSGGPTSLLMAQVEEESGAQRQAAGSYEQATQAFEAVVRIRRAELAPGDPAISRSLSRLAFAMHLDRRYPAAVASYRETLAAQESEERPSLDERIAVLNRLAWIYQRAALDERATQLHDLVKTTVAASSASGGHGGRMLEIGLEELEPNEQAGRARMRMLAAFALEWIDERHLHRHHFDLEERLLVALRRRDRQLPLERIQRSLERELRASLLGFAPPMGRPRTVRRYALPFETEEPRRVASTSEGAHGYQRVYLHGFDFELPPGAKVLAARAGVVARVVDGFEAAALSDAEGDARHGERVNRVVVLHEDGSYATYQPLAPGIPVAEDEEIEQGTPIGITAAGSAADPPPILHFDVRRNHSSSSEVLAEPLRVGFASVADRDGVPIAGRLVGGPDSPRARPASAYRY